MKKLRKFLVEAKKNTYANENAIKNRKVIWVMNYYGKITSKISSKEIYKFLKKVLTKVKLKNPFMGPDEFNEGNFQYINKTKGNINSFKGIEKILYNKKRSILLQLSGRFC